MMEYQSRSGDSLARDGTLHEVVFWLSVKWRRGVLRSCRFHLCGEGIFKAWGSIVRWLLACNRRCWRIGSRSAEHRFDEPARLSLGMVASRQSPPPFHQQVHCSSAAHTRPKWWHVSDLQCAHDPPCPHRCLGAEGLCGNLLGVLSTCQSADKWSPQRPLLQEIMLAAVERGFLSAGRCHLFREETTTCDPAQALVPFPARSRPYMP